MGLGESGCQKPLPEGGWCQVQARQYRETAVREIKAHTLPVSGTCLSFPWLHIKAHAGLQTPSVPFHEYLLCISKSTPASWPFSPLYLNSQAHPDHRLPSPQLLLSEACSVCGQGDRKASCPLSLRTRNPCLSRQGEGSRERIPNTDRDGGGDTDGVGPRGLQRVHWSCLPHITK